MKKIILFNLIISVVMTGCLSIYVPTTPTPALFTEKNDGMASISFTRGTYHVNGAYTPIKHVFAAAEFSIAPLDATHYYRYAGLGLGAYFKLGKKYHLEILGGYGNGKGNYANPLSNSEAYLNFAAGPYKKFYQQIFISKFQSDVLRHGLSLRLNQLDMNYTRVTDSHQYILIQPNKFLIFEPSYYVKYNFVDFINVFGSAGLTLSNGNKGHNINYNYVNVRVGIEFKFK